MDSLDPGRPRGAAEPLQERLAEDRPGDSGPVGWTVWRQDDNGNRFQVSRHDTREAADAVAEAMEARGHKQTYWVSPSA
jgi:hypothetical protein